MSAPGEPCALFVDGLASLDAAETRKRLALAMAAVRAAHIESRDGALLGTLHRVEAALLAVARRSVQDLARALAEHEAKLTAPVGTVPEKPARPGPRLPPRIPSTP